MDTGLSVTWIVSGITLGFTAGLIPGPMHAVILTQSLRHGWREGVLAAIAPLVTDPPVILLAVLLLQRVTGFDSVMGVISLAGAVFLIRLGIAGIRTGSEKLDTLSGSAHSLRKGILVNILNPNPYLFWMLVGAPIIVRAGAAHPVNAAGFLLCFYICMESTHMAIAVLAHKARAWFSGNTHTWVMRALGIVLLVFAALFLRDGLRHLHLI